jgi:glutamate synthase (NADPH/NADH) small chain
MAKPTGFMEYPRAVPADRDAKARVADWNEFHGSESSEKDHSIQAARCMDCGTPFCHSGILYEGAVSGCPINNLIPEWNDLIWRGRWREALERLRLTNNFPEFTGRVCPAPCEGACTMGSMELPAIAIKHNELSIIDRGWEEGWLEPEPPARRSGKKVAVVGSGPAGLACADQLNQAGHEVTVYERAERAGGLLTFGIPNMKLDKAIVARRLALMEAEGVRIVTGVEVGVATQGAELLASNDAVVLAAGAAKPRDLPIEGRGSKGVHFALEFLGDATRGLLGLETKTAAITAKGKDVVVIGGGDTGNDCVGTAIRQGAKSITQIEIMPKPPASRAADNPWPRWPRVLKTDYGQEEAAALFGADPRLFQATAKAFVTDASGTVSAISLVDVEWVKDDKGRIAPKELPATERKLPAQLVLIAMGFLGPEERLLSAFGVEADPRSNVKAAYGSFATSVKGLFAAGDCRRGQSLVVWAIDEGRNAAREVDRWLMGRTMLP